MEACGECESCRSFAEGRSYCIHELDAASNNSVEDIRLLSEQVRVPPQVGKYSVYIIDEVHMLSPAAFNAFLKTLEEPPEYAIFILATTEKHKILPTILSRCQIYDFNRISVEGIVSHLEEIATKEGVKYEHDALNIIARKADGAMRDALSIFDRVVSFCGDSITYHEVIEDLNILDYEYYFRLTDAFVEGKYAESIKILNEILQKGFDPQHFIGGLCSHFRDLLVCKDPSTIMLLEVGKNIAERYLAQAATCSLSFLFGALNISSQCEAGYKASGYPRLHVELALLNLSNMESEKKNAIAESSSEPDNKVSPTRTATPSTEVAAKPVSTLPSMPKSISLRSISEASAKPAPTETKIVQQALSNEFTEEKLREVWLAYSETVRAPRLKSWLQEHNPERGEGFIIIYPSINNEHKQRLIDLSSGLIGYLREKLANTEIDIDWRIITDREKQEAEHNIRPYTPWDILKFMSQKNPTIEDMRRELDLDVR
jgi:DNA polymerase-3 subunit gamma/tau